MNTNILVKFKHRTEYIPYTTNIFAELITDNDTETIINESTGEIIYHDNGKIFDLSSLNDDDPIKKIYGNRKNPRRVFEN